MSQSFIDEINGYINKAKKVLEKDKANPQAQNVVFYGDIAIRSAKLGDKARMRNNRCLVIGYMSE